MCRRPEDEVFPDVLRTDALRDRELEAMGLTRQHWRTVLPFRYVSARFGTVTVPAGEVTDYGSVPFWAKWLVDDDSREMLRPSQPHDFIYRLKGILPSGRKRRWSRLEADWCLYEAMLAIGAHPLKAFIVFVAVRLGGWLHWR